MGTSALPVLLVLGLVAFSPSSAAAQGDDDTVAMSLLHRALQAASTVSYSGVQVVATWSSSGSSTRVIEVSQRPGGLRSLTVRGAGAQAATTTRWPAPGGTQLNSSDALDLIAAAFQVRLGGQARVAGRPASIVVASRDGRVAAQLWVDEATGLLLRQERYDPQGRLIRMSGFLDVDVAPGSPAGSTALPGPAAAGPLMAGPVTAALLPRPRAATGQTGAVTIARRLGCSLPAALPGGFRMVDARTVAAGVSGGQAVHLTYSDGLSGLSVFAQDGRLPAVGVPGLERQSWDGVAVYVGRDWPVRVVWQGDGEVMTTVSDAPLDEVRAVVTALPHGGATGHGVVGRLATMLHAAMDLLPSH